MIKFLPMTAGGEIGKNFLLANIYVYSTSVTVGEAVNFKYCDCFSCSKLKPVVMLKTGCVL